jgi:drug/metabolite transporter (DMT)-like permease
VWLALGIVYIVWGSTYLAIRVVVTDGMPPLMAAGLRFLLAAVILAAFAAVRRGPGALRLSRAEWLGSSFIGLALLLGGNGLVMLGERDVPSALAALIIAVVPLYVVVLRFLFGEKVSLVTALGVIVGLAGVALLIVPRGIDGSVALPGMLMLLGASASWSVGSYLSKRVSLPADPLMSTGAQMLVGGAAMLAVGAAVGEVGLIHPEQFRQDELISFVYLVLFGSIFGYTAYTWLLQHTSVSKVATYAFVNPVVAIILGALLLHEEINATMIGGAAMIVLAVALVIRTESRRSPPPTGAAEAAPAIEAEPA